jgi:methylated-DNA-[protein]-cysteine S-methyltransferase
LTAGSTGGGIILSFNPPSRGEASAAALEFHGLPQLSLHTPVGDLTVSEEAGAIVAVDWGWGRDQTPTPLLLEACRQLQDYFDGQRSDFALPLLPCGTPYRQRVWGALLTIPSGETRRYADIARAAGGSPRSVGGANGANPIPIIIPCHRVVASNGIGYSGGDGLATKRFLLALETRPLPPTSKMDPL